MPELSVVVPCYNEEKNLPFIIKGFDSVVRSNASIEVLLVNNGSADNTEEVLKNEIEALPHKQITIVNLPVNQGYGYGILQGLKQAKGNILAWTHADGQTDPADLLRAWEKYKEYNDSTVLVKGQRKNRGWGAAFFTWGMQVMANCLLKTRLHDINAQPKLFSRTLYEKIAGQAPQDFSLDVYFLYQAQRLGSIKTIPVQFNKRLYGEAKGGGSFKTRIKLMRRTLTYLRRLKKELAQSSES
jgi:glycosyltransferase involved in cell wall biosynthesis